MLRSLKNAALNILRTGGAFELLADSDWRHQRLLILCYHGISLEDEHLWRPLYFEQSRLRQRFAYLKGNGFSVLPLADALDRLHAGNLPARSIALTFDDGTYDFYKQAYPVLKEYSFPATVYQTTYYVSNPLPVFNLICSYMLWTRRNEVIKDGAAVGVTEPMDLRTPEGRTRVMRGLLQFSQAKDRNARQKDEIAAQLAELLKVDYGNLKAKRILQLMNPAELREVSRNGIDIQLHTHRHRTPEDETLFRKEIQDNRVLIEAITETRPKHFCYPSGIYQREFLSWLRAEEVVSATTCDAGLATKESEPLLLSRSVDTPSRSQLEFESWATGVGDWLAFRRQAKQHAPNRR